MITRIFLALSLCVCFNTSAFAGSDSGLKDIFDRLDKLTCEQATELFQDPNMKAAADDSIDGIYLKRIVETYALLGRCALNVRTRTELYDGILRGMVTALGDPHSEYMNDEAFERQYRQSSGQFIGIGVTLERQPKDGALRSVKVVQTLSGAPAEKAGLKSGDIIVKLNDRAVSEYKSLDDVLKDIRGLRGSILNLTIVRDGIAEPFIVSIVRDEIKTEFQKTTLLPNKWFLARIESFEGAYVPETRTLALCADIESAYKKALASEPNMKGVILDLRNNPGGYVSGARCVVDLFATESHRGQQLLSVETRDGLQPYPSVINPRDILQGKPLIVLVNEYSASASEIVAKAVQYYNLGTVVGTQTYGKGSMQMVFPLADTKAALRYTIAQYLVGPVTAPAAVQGIGVTPNIVAKPKVSESDLEKVPAISRESDLVGALPTSTVAKEIAVKDIKAIDPALYEEIIRVITSAPFNMKVEEVLMP